MEVESRKTIHLGPGEGVGTVRMPGAELVTRKVTAEQTGGAYSLFEVAVAPEGGSAPHVQHREDECFWVLEGRFGFVIEGDMIEANPGTLIYVPKGTLHAFRNADEMTGRLLVSQTPGGAYEGFVEEVGEPATGEATPPATEEPPEEPPNNAERRAAVGAAHGIEMVPSLP